MKRPENGEDKASRQCWECHKRRLVCDYTLPHCKKCQRNGRACPGYDEQRPLQWVETGKVTSRRSKLDKPPKKYVAPVKLKEGVEVAMIECPKRPETTLVPAKDDEFECFADLDDVELAIALSKLYCDAYGGFLTNGLDEFALQELGNKLCVDAESTGQIFSNGGRTRIEDIVKRRAHDEAASLVGAHANPLRRLERLMCLMRLHDLPHYDYLSTETSEVVQAVQYYNSRIHPQYIDAGTLAPNPGVILFPVAALHVLPPAIHHTLVCLSLNHFVHRLPEGASRAIVVSNRSKVYHHRGAAIRALSTYVGKTKTRCSDMTIASILMFMSMELQNPVFADWRSHANGLNKLIALRGGLRSLVKQAPHLATTIVIYALIIAVANSCSPSLDHIDISSTPANSIAEVSEMYSFIFPYTLCPPQLFLDMMRINHLRSKVATSLLTCDMDPDHALEALDLLARIEAFVPEDWAQPGEHHEEWLLIGSIYQSALAVYCTMAFQSLTILPMSLEMNAMRDAHGTRMFAGLRDAVKMPRLNMFLTWPVTVAGVEAAYGSQTKRDWVDRQLGDLSRLLGTSSPLKARAVLRRYWARSEPGWDECFDRPYVFII